MSKKTHQEIAEIHWLVTLPRRRNAHRIVMNMRRLSPGDRPEPPLVIEVLTEADKYLIKMLSLELRCRGLSPLSSIWSTVSSVTGGAVIL